MFEGKPVTGGLIIVDYVFAKVNPKEWSDKYGVKDFLFIISFILNLST